MQAYSTTINCREFCNDAKFSQLGNPDLHKILCKQCNNRMKFVLFDNGMKSLIEGYHCYCCGMNRLKERCL
ncbi:hypothetical protein HZA96_05520 [Candidatus Woesearchaeota archaeon]|nr:hypothetical protein [Candidatus Woesearchaeota archaeon]